VLLILNKWCSTWGFLLSPNKTVGIIFSRKRNLGKLVLKIGTHILEIVKEVKFLGIIFDCRLTWLKLGPDFHIAPSSAN
jgi:hypothetical protein